MPRRSMETPPLFSLEESLNARTVDELKWAAAGLPGNVPARKADLVQKIYAALAPSAQLRALWVRLSPGQQDVIAEVVHRLAGRYDRGVLAAKYPGVPAPTLPTNYYSWSRTKQSPVTPFDLLFCSLPEIGTYIPSDVAALLRAFVPLPPAVALTSQDAPPTLGPSPMTPEWQPEVLVSETERAVFHDLAATLDLVQQGKIRVGGATRFPTLPALKALRERLLLGEYFADLVYERAEDAIRPLALVLLVQAAGWATPDAPGGPKLALTKSGKTVLAGPPGAAQVREAWERWLKSDLLDELARIRAIKGQQSRDARLTKPAERRAKLAVALQGCPVGRWVGFDEFLRYMRAADLLPVIERNEFPALYIGSYHEPGLSGFEGGNYWDIITGSYLRVVLWEYAATLGLIEIAYTAPEDADRDLDHLDYFDEDYLSRYDGLLGLRLTNLGAYVLGLAGSYTPPAPAVATGPPLLRLLPNLDLVVTDARRATPNDRAFLARIGVAQSEDVYRLNRDLLLDAVENGLDLPGVQDFLAAKSGTPAAEFPQMARVFFADLARRLGALREHGRMLVLDGDDPYLLTELSNDAGLRSLVQLARIGERTVLLVPEAGEAAVRRQLKKLGYLARR